MIYFKNRWFLLRLASFFVTSLLLVFFFKTMTYNATINAAMNKIEMMLMTNRAITEFVSKEQKPSMQAFEKQGFVPLGHFEPKLQSGSYITKRIHHYYNLEQKHLNHPTHEYKISTNNPLNPQNLANDLEKKILRKMNEDGLKETKELIEKSGKSYLYYALALPPVTHSCLGCHGDPKDAPESLVAYYGTSSGFGYKVGEVVGMNSIYTPVDEELKAGHELFIYLSALTMIILFIVFLLTEYMFLQINKKRQILKHNKHLENELENQNEALQKSLHMISQHIMLSKTDTKGKITEVSEALCEISGYSMEELVGYSHDLVRNPDMPSSVFKEMWDTITEGKTWQGEIKNRNKDGGDFWVDMIVAPDFNEAGEIIGYSSFWHDASHKKRMEIMSITDTLTQLYNRRHFQTIFEQERLRAQRDKKFFVFMMIDLDFFKRYNDTYGHQAGDRVLEETARVMRETFQRPCDFCFRLGGEEFGIVYNANDESGALLVAKQLCHNLEALKIEHKHNKASHFVTASIGVAILSPEMKLNMDEMISKADEALYKAKHEGRNRVSLS